MARLIFRMRMISCGLMSGSSAAVFRFPIAVDLLVLICLQMRSCWRFCYHPSRKTFTTSCPKSQEKKDIMSVRKVESRQIGEKLREIRECLGLTQDAMADQLGGIVTGGALGKYEKGERTIPIDVICRIATLGKVSVDYYPWYAYRRLPCYGAFIGIKRTHRQMGRDSPLGPPIAKCDRQGGRQRCCLAARGRSYFEPSEC